MAIVNLRNQGLLSLDEYVFPVGILGLDVSNNSLVNLIGTPNTLDTLIVNNNPLTTLDGVATTIAKLDAKNCLLTTLDSAPINLRDGGFINNSIVDVSGLANCSLLRTINLRNNNITTLASFPLSLNELYIENNKITTFDGSMPNLHTLNLRKNPFNDIDGIPRTVCRLDISEITAPEFTAIDFSRRMNIVKKKHPNKNLSGFNSDNIAELNIGLDSYNPSHNEQYIDAVYNKVQLYMNPPVFNTFATYNNTWTILDHSILMMSAPNDFRMSGNTMQYIGDDDCHVFCTMSINVHGPDADVFRIVVVKNEARAELPMFVTPCVIACAKMSSAGSTGLHLNKIIRMTTKDTLAVYHRGLNNTTMTLYNYQAVIQRINLTYS